MKLTIQAATIVAIAILSVTACKPNESKIPAADQVDNTAEVEAIAKEADPSQAQVDQYNKDENEMAERSEAMAANAARPMLEKAVAGQTGTADNKYLDKMVDLNGDGVLDAVVVLQGMDWCGSGGCTMMVYEGGKDAMTFKSKSTVTDTPIRVAMTKTNGWNDLIVSSDGKDRKLAFDGKNYPANPSLVSPAQGDQVTAAKVLIPSS